MNMTHIIQQYLKSEDIESFLANTPQITFEITDSCNLNCTYCGYGDFYSDYEKREDKMLPVVKVFRFLNHIIMKKVLFILLFIMQLTDLQAQQYLRPSPGLPEKYKVLDSANIKITYNLTYLKDSTKTNDKYNDLETLLIGMNTS